MDGQVWAESPAERGRPYRAKDETEDSDTSKTSASRGGGPGSIFHYTAWLEKSQRKRERKPAPVFLLGRKVLVMDDTKPNRDILTHVLDEAGMRVVSFKGIDGVKETIQDALDSKDPFDLCIFDLKLPEGSAYDLVKWIRRSEIPDLRLLAFSSSIEENAKKSMEAGFDGFLPKPVRKEKLLEMVEWLLGETAEKAGKRLATQYSLREEKKHSLRILLAEDNPVNQNLALMMLTKAGYQVEVADNGKETLEKYTAAPEKYDLIFMDMQMPHMDGLEATGAIRDWEKMPLAQASQADEASASSGQRGRVPIVAMTANVMKGDRERCLEAGMDDYIAKPFKREEVFQIVQRWVLS
jgi:CheY-like chemotaxis protein